MNLKTFKKYISALLSFTLIALLFFLLSNQVHASTFGISRPVNSLGLVGYWTFDGKNTPWTSATAGTTLDSSGNGNTGTLTNMAQATSPVAGKIGQGLDFGGVDDYINIGNVGSGIRTISFWIKAPSAASQKIINIDGTDQIETNGSSQITATSFPGATVYVNGVAGSTISAGTWNHVTITDSTGVNASTFELGRVSSTYLSGSLDDVRIYNRALSTTEITQLYNTGISKFGVSPTKALTSGLVGYWTFDGKNTPWTSATAGTTLDSSGSGNTGTLTNMSQATSPVAGKIGQGLSFDGVNDYVVSSIGGSLNLTHTGTVSAWAKFTSATVYMVIAGNENWATDRNGFAIGTWGTAGRLGFDMGNAAGDNYINTTSAWNNGQWHMVTAKWDGSYMNLYVDGVSAATQKSQTIDAVSNVYAFTIGKNPAANNYYFNGSIDDVRVYNRALSATEILQLYNLGR
ncbi:MAG: LamG-like jellyroll fold domain-containing protein [Candidatus Paceibacterota bacterium]|jgi:hypothetical protein